MEEQIPAHTHEKRKDLRFEKENLFNNNNLIILVVFKTKKQSNIEKNISQNVRETKKITSFKT